MAINITNEALAKLIELQKLNHAHENKPIRFSIQGGGCAGFNFKLDIDSNGVKENDNVFKFRYGEKDLILVVDPKSYLFVNGTEIDYVNTLMEQKFVFNNPNASSTCGCGTSFAV